MNEKTLIMTVGLPRSGKSSWSRRQGYPVVCPDAIRLALHGQRYVQTAEPLVWATARLMVASLFGAGHDRVILDACSVSQRRRDEWQDPRWACVFRVFLTPKEVCMRRADETGRQDILPIIEGMAGDFTMPPEAYRWYEEAGEQT